MFQTKPKQDNDAVIIEEKVVDSEGKITCRNYLKGHLLGKGGFAKCYEVIDMETNQVYASKIVAKETLIKGRARQKVKYLLITTVRLRNTYS